MKGEAPAETKAKKPAKGIQSIEVGYRVLLAVQRGPTPIPLSEIAKRAGLSTGATHNYLVSLGRTGLIEQEGRGSYRLGPSAFALSVASFQQLSSFDLLRDATRRLHQATGKSVAASVWSQAGPVSVYKQQSDDYGIFEFRTGLLPFSLRTAAAMVFVAYLPEEMTLGAIRQELAQMKRPESEAADIISDYKKAVLPHQYAFSVYKGELHEDIGAMAAPVFGKNRDVAFTLSILGRVREVDPAHNEALVSQLLETVDTVSKMIYFGAS